LTPIIKQSKRRVLTISKPTRPLMIKKRKKKIPIKILEVSEKKKDDTIKAKEEVTMAKILIISQLFGGTDISIHSRITASGTIINTLDFT